MKEIQFDPGKMNLPLCDSPLFWKRLSELNLKAEEKEILIQYHEEGFVTFKQKLIDEGQIGRIIQSLKGKYTGSATGHGHGGRIQDAWLFNDDVKKMASHPKVLELLRSFYQRTPIPFQTLNFAVGTEQRGHSDTLHFDSIPAGFMCGLWVAFEDVDSENGPLFYYPKSHRLPIYDMFSLGLPSSYEHYLAYEDFVEQMMIASKLEKREVHLKKGEAILWAANLIHGGSRIKDPARTRHSQVTHYYFENCLYYQPGSSEKAIGRLSLKDIFNIATGERIPNKYRGEIIKETPHLLPLSRILSRKKRWGREFAYKTRQKLKQILRAS